MDYIKLYGIWIGLLLCFRLLCGCSEKPAVNEWVNAAPLAVVSSHTNSWGTNSVRVQVDGGYISNGLIVVTNLRASSNYTVAMYRSDIEAVTNGTLADRISNLATLYFEKGFDAGFACGRSGGNETNAAMIKAWHRNFIKSLDKLPQ